MSTINLAVLRNMITNPIYIGKLRYQGKVYDAEHEGIISPELWQKTAAGLAGLLKEAGADFEIADGNQVLDCVITVPCLLRRSSGKLEIQVECEDVPEQPTAGLEKFFSRKSVSA